MNSIPSATSKYFFKDQNQIWNFSFFVFVARKTTMSAAKWSTVEDSSGLREEVGILIICQIYVCSKITDTKVRTQLRMAHRDYPLGMMFQ